MIKLSEEDLNVFRQALDNPNTTEEIIAAVKHVDALLDRIEEELLDRGIAEVQFVSD